MGVGGAQNSNVGTDGLSEAVLMQLGAGGFDNWIMAMFFGLLSLGLMAFVAPFVWRRPRGSRLASFSGATLTLLGVFAVSMAIVYAVESKPLWDARAKLDDNFDLVAELIDKPVVVTEGYGPITIFDPDRPQIGTDDCDPVETRSRGKITFADPIDGTCLLYTSPSPRDRG